MDQPIMNHSEYTAATTRTFSACGSLPIATSDGGDVALWLTHGTVELHAWWEGPHATPKERLLIVSDGTRQPSRIVSLYKAGGWTAKIEDLPDHLKDRAEIVLPLLDAAKSAEIIARQVTQRSRPVRAPNPAKVKKSVFAIIGDMFAGQPRKLTQRERLHSDLKNLTTVNGNSEYEAAAKFVESLNEAARGAISPAPYTWPE